MAERIWIGTDSGNDGKYATAANWSGSAVPQAGDDVIFRNSSQDVDGDLDQSAIALASFTVEQSYTGDMGTISGNVVTYLQIATALLSVGRHDGYSSPTGSGQILLDLGSSTACTGTVYRTASTATVTNFMPLQLLAANNSTKLYIQGGKVGFANAMPTETSTIDTIDVGVGAQVTTGAGLTLENWIQTGGTGVLRSATSVKLDLLGGELRTEGTGTHAIVNVYGGLFIGNSVGAIAKLNGYGGIGDFIRSAQARTLTETDIWRGFTLRIDPAYITMTADPEPQEEMALIAGSTGGI